MTHTLVSEEAGRSSLSDCDRLCTLGKPAVQLPLNAHNDKQCTLSLQVKSFW